MSNSDSTSMEGPSLHERLTEHLQTCSECQAVTENRTRPLGMGMSSPLCSRYRAIIQEWADSEGAINNIVAHDEFGNPASDKQYTEQTYPWRL